MADLLTRLAWGGGEAGSGPTMLRAIPGGITAVGVEPGETPIGFIQRWVRRRMPAFGGRGAEPADRVLVVRARTGAGKSTIMPVGLFRLLRAKEAGRQRYRGPSVLCTQPRVLTAKSLAEGIAANPANPDMVLGETVGFLTGPIRNAPVAGLVFATSGVLAAQLTQLEDAELMARYRVIIVDEAHERSLDADVTLCLLRHFYLRNAGNAQLPFLVLTSATFVPERYAEYFGVGPANVVLVEGRQHGITTHWPARGFADYTAGAAETALRIHAEYPDAPGRGDILVFLPGAAEIKAVAKLLRAALETPALAARPFLLLTIDSGAVALELDDYRLAFTPFDRLPPIGGVAPVRRIILSTTVAETGVTVDSLRHVVDCGWSRAPEAYWPEGAAGIVTRPAAQSRVHQRQGRAGRVFPGDFHPLYSEAAWAALDENQLPEIVTQGPGGRLLALARAQQRQRLRRGEPPEFRVEGLGLLDPPTAEAFRAENSAAAAMGLVSPRAPLPSRWPPAMLEAATPTEPEPAGPLAPARGYGLTSLGHLAALFTRTPMEGVRALLAGYEWGVAASDLVTAAAMAMGDLTLEDLVDRKALRVGGLPPDSAALAAALPEFLRSRWTGRTGGGDDGPPAGELYYYRARLLLADSFAEAALLFDAFAAELGADPERPLPHLVEWCRGLGLRPDKLFLLVKHRAEVAEELALAGLDPYRLDDRRLAALAAQDFTEGLARFKRCLYEGHRRRLLRWDDAAAGYLSPQGVKVRVPGVLAPALQSRLRALGAVPEEFAPPRWLVTDRLRLVPAAKRAGDPERPLLYAVEAGLVSVLDGFLPPDPDLDGPRTVPATATGDTLPGAIAASLPGINDPLGDTPDPRTAAAQLAAYDRALEADQEAASRGLEAPVLKLGDYLRAVLFAPRQQELLITAPLGREPLECPDD